MKGKEKLSFVESTKNIFALAVRFQSQRSSVLNRDFLNIKRAEESFMFYCPLIDHHAVVFMMKHLSAYYLRQFRLWPRKLDKSPPTPPPLPTDFGALN